MRRIMLAIAVTALATMASQVRAATPATADVGARLLVSNPAPYVGAELDLIFEVRYWRYPGGHASLTWPTDDRFLASDPALSRSSRQRTADGTIIETLQRRLQPLQSGPLLLKGARLSFGDLEVPVTPVTLQVRALPQQSRPADFSGLVGHYRLQLDAKGHGERDIAISIIDDGQVGPPPTPRFAIGGDDRLILLGSESQPLPGGARQHRWRYYFLPAATASEQLQARLVTFNSESGQYQQLQAGTAAPAAETAAGTSVWPWALLLTTLATAAAFVIRHRPRPVEYCLQRMLGCAPHKRSRQELVEALDQRLDPPTLELLQAWWRHQDRQWGSESTTAFDRQIDTRELRRRLRKIIDKKNRIPYRDRTR